MGDGGATAAAAQSAPQQQPPPMPPAGGAWPPPWAGGYPGAMPYGPTTMPPPWFAPGGGMPQAVPLSASSALAAEATGGLPEAKVVGVLAAPISLS